MLIALSVAVCLGTAPCEIPARIEYPEPPRPRYFTSVMGCQMAGMFFLPTIGLQPGEAAAVRCTSVVDDKRTG